MARGPTKGVDRPWEFVAEAAPNVSGEILLASDDPPLKVRGTMIEAAQSWPRPKYESLDRYGFYDLPRYAGHEPFQVELRIRIGDGERNLDSGENGPIRSLERMAERAQGKEAPPEIRIDGPVPHATLRWQITSVVEDLARTQWVVGSGGRYRVLVVVTVGLQQRVTETLLSTSLGTATSRSAAGIGSLETVKDGDDDLYDFAQRVFNDSSMAIPISRVNPVKGKPMPLGTKLKAGQKLRLP